MFYGPPHAAGPFPPRRVSVACPEMSKIQKILFEKFPVSRKGNLVSACCVFLWDRVITAFGKGVAPQYPPQRQERSFQKSVFFQSLKSILRTSGHKSATGLFVGGDIPLIKADKPQSDAFHSFIAPWRSSTLCNISFTAFIDTWPVLVRATRITS